MSCERARTALGTSDAPSMGGSHCSRKICGRQTPAAMSSVMQLRQLTGTCRLTCPRPAVPPCSVDSSSCHTGRTAWQVDSGGIFSCSRPLAGGLRTVHRLAIAPHITKKREIPLALPSECTKNQLLITLPWPLSRMPLIPHIRSVSTAFLKVYLEFSCFSPPAETRAEPYHLFLRQF